MRLRPRVAVGAALTAAAAVAVWWALGDDAALRAVSPPQRAAAGVLRIAAVGRGVAVASSRGDQGAPSRGRAEPARLAACPGQRFEIVRDGRAETQCVGSLQAVQNGSTRSYRAEAAGGAGHWLDIETAGGQVLSVGLGRGAGAEFVCEAQACAGVALGPADLRGVRGISLDGTWLAPAAGSGPSGSVLRLSGRLESQPDDAVQAVAACADQQVLISTAAAGTARFCAEDGVAVVRHDGGARSYRFNGIDGVGIEVAVDGEGRLVRVAAAGAACAAQGCAGVSLSSPGPEGERSLVFNGTLLQADQESAPGAWAGLSGRLVLPAS